MRRPPTWLAPWLIPLAMLIGVASAAIALWLCAVVLLVCAGVILPYLRLQYLKDHPPDPELRRRNFWDLR